jgi:hypothetical protein
MSSNGDNSRGRCQDAHIHTLNNGLKVLVNLVYLTRFEALHPEKVNLYMDMADSQLSVLAAVMREVKVS